MNCKICGQAWDDYADQNVQCSNMSGHFWPELNEPQPTQYESAQPCGCDPGAKWTCQWHQAEKGRLSIQHCESCGPILSEVRRHEGTDWCQACFNAEGWTW